MSMPVSARLAVWASAWLRGHVAYDDVLEAMHRTGHVHLVVGLPPATEARRSIAAGRSTGEDLTRGSTPVRASDDAASTGEPAEGGPADRLGAALIAWRGHADAIDVVFAAPGDVRGLPGRSPFSAAALAAGQAVLGGGLGLVPTMPTPGPSSARSTVVWQAYAIAAPAPDPLQLTDAGHELAVAMRETASLFSGGGLGGTRTDVSEDLARARRAGERIDLPHSFPPRAAALVAQAERLSAVVEIAARDNEGGAVDRTGINTRAEALRTLAATVRRARQAAYNPQLRETQQP